MKKKRGRKTTAKKKKNKNNSSSKAGLVDAFISNLVNHSKDKGHSPTIIKPTT